MAPSSLRGLAPLSLQRLVEIPVRLQVHPQLRGGLQEPTESQGGIGSHTALSEDDFVQSVTRDTAPAGCLDLPNAEGLQIFLEQDFPRVNAGPQPPLVPSDNLRRRLRRHDRSPTGR